MDQKEAIQVLLEFAKDMRSDRYESTHELQTSLILWIGTGELEQAMRITEANLATDGRIGASGKQAK